MQRRGEHLDPVAPLVLGVVLGLVGLAEKLLRRHPVRSRKGDAHAGGHRHQPTAERERLVETAMDAMGGVDRLRGAVQVPEQHRELVAAQPSQHVAFAEHAADTVGRLHQQLVARLMAK